MDLRQRGRDFTIRDKSNKLLQLPGRRHLFLFGLSEAFCFHFLAISFWIYIVVVELAVLKGFLLLRTSGDVLFLALYYCYSNIQA